MYNLLIVDDEPFIINGLKMLFEEHLPYEIYTADSGNSALEKLNKIRIDIIICDINMDDLDGLKLQEIVIKKWSLCKMIFLSAYDDIKYVKPALQNNAVDYLVKTCSDEDILQSISKAVNLIKEDEKKISSNILLKDDKFIPFLEHSFYFNLLNNNILSSGDIKDRINTLGLPFDAQLRLHLMIARLDPVNDGITMGIDRIYKLGFLFEQFFQKYIYIKWFVNLEKEVVFFMQSTQSVHKTPLSIKESEDYIYALITGMMKNIQLLCKDTFNTSVSVALSKHSESWLRLNQKYESLSLSLNYIYGFENELITDEYFLNEKNNDVNTINNTSIFILREIKKLEIIEIYLENNNITEYEKKVNTFISFAKDRYKTNSNIGIEIYTKLSSIIISHINKLQLWENLSCHIDTKLLTNIYLFDNWETVSDFFISVGRHIISVKYEIGMQYKEDITEQVNNYIKNNMHKDISLDRIAAHVNFNPYYLSRLYRKLSGCNISDFIKKVRLEKAKWMLEYDDMKIMDVTKAVGFSHQAYFSRFFKKSTGISPVEYKRKHSKEVNKS